MHNLTRLCLLLLLFYTTVAQSIPITEEQIPQALKPWVDWVLYGHEEAQCPFIYNNAQQHLCSWPSYLELDLQQTEGAFTQHWLMLKAGWVNLPGDAQRWPQQVQINEEDVLIAEDAKGLPRIYLETGWYELSGHWNWRQLPKSIQLPANTGIVKLTTNNQAVDFPDLDAKGKLWLSQRQNQQKKTIENRLDIQVYRKLVDTIPFKIITRIQLDVAGQPREIVLGQRLVDKQFLPFSLESPLPARLEADGRLRLQVRPGRWQIILTTRSHEPVTELNMPTPNGVWSSHEIWVFAAENHLRLTEIQGATVIDPQQTDLISSWRKYPAYRLTAGQHLKIIEQKRGDPDPGPDELKLKRKLWLDFAGQGYTVHDEISGTVRRSWRLEMQPDIQLGRVGINGLPQLITQQPNSSLTGVEIRQGHLNLVADSRLEGNIAQIPAIGWQHDFQQLDMILNLPPGWRLLHASGADTVNDTWLQSWSLLDLFLVLIIALAFAKLWHWGWGFLALLTLAFIYHEPLAPHWIWLNVLAAIAVLRLLPTGRLKTWLTYYRNLSLFALMVIGALFMADQARKGIYPQLEKPWNTASFSDVLTPTAMDTFDDNMIAQSSALPSKMSRISSRASGYKKRIKKHFEPQQQNRTLLQYDEKANIQTGPGLQKWEWNRIDFGWSGPVNQGQSIQLYLLNPQQNMWLNFLRIPLLALLLWCILDIQLKKKTVKPTTTKKSRGKTKKMANIVIAFGIMALLPVPEPAVASDIPSAELLKTLEQRLSQPAECLPNCASSPHLLLEANGDTLRMLWHVHSLAPIVVPLPANAKHWLPQWVFVNGEAVNGLQRNAKGQLLLPLPKGNHQIFMEGQLPKRRAIQIPLILRPHQIETQIYGWTLEGLDDKQQAEHIQLTRVTDQQQTTLEAGTLPAFVQIERTLSLGLSWQVDTKITRLSPGKSAIVLDVPLLTGESVTTEGIQVNAGLAQVTMRPNQKTFHWSSVFNQRSMIVLKAPVTQQWSEVWKLNISPIWHVTMQGIPVVHHQNPQGEWLPEWRPWPNETVELKITRPIGVTGQTLTIDSSQLQISPGQRATEMVLTAHLRSSQGGQHHMILPPQAELRSAKINGKSQPIRQEQSKVTLPLVPGQQTIELTFWQTQQGIASVFKSPVVNLGAPSVNSHVNVTMPNRWILWVQGPTWGPAILFWGVLIVVVLAGFALARVPFLPLRSYEWILLGIGLTQADPDVALMVVIWFFALGKRPTLNYGSKRWLFNLTQVALVFLTFAAMGALVTAIQQGLLGHPDMHIVGNQSSATHLHWFADRVGESLPQVSVVSVPLIVYRGVMLLWALWLAFACLRWLRWGWSCYSKDGIWRSVSLKTTAETK